MFFEVPGLNLGEPNTEKVSNPKSPKQIDLKLKTIKDKTDFKNSYSSDKIKMAKKKPVSYKSVAITPKIDKTRGKNTESGKSRLQQKMEEKLRGARFRYLNQKLYQSNSQEALVHFKDHPEDFQNYHEGFRSQVLHWPVNPVDLFIQQLEKEIVSQKMTVVDMGCGEAKIMQTFAKIDNPNSSIKVHSFDLASSCPGVIVCDMSKVPLPDASVDVVIFCLSLMNTNFIDAIKEAKRILKPKSGILRIAEVESRFENGPTKFISTIEEIGFKKRYLDTQYKVFTLFEFCSMDHIVSKYIHSSEKIDNEQILKPCLYKKR